MKKLLSLFLSLLFVMGTVAIGFCDQKASAVTAYEVLDRLSELDKNGFQWGNYGNLKPNSDFTDGECWQYVKGISSYVYNTSVSIPNTASYLGGGSIGDYYRVSAALKNCSYDQIIELLKISQPGDIIGFRNSKVNAKYGHIMFIGNITGKKITFYQEASGKTRKDTVDLTVKGLKGLYSFGYSGDAEFNSDNYGISLFRCNKRTGQGDYVYSAIHTFSTSIKPKDYNKFPEENVSDNDNVLVKISEQSLEIQIKSDSINDGKIFLPHTGYIESDTKVVGYPYIELYIDDFNYDYWEYRNQNKTPTEDNHAFVFRLSCVGLSRDNQYIPLSDLDYELMYVAKWDVKAVSYKPLFIHDPSNSNGPIFDYTNSFETDYSKDTIILKWRLPSSVSDTNLIFNYSKVHSYLEQWNLFTDENTSINKSHHISIENRPDNKIKTVSYGTTLELKANVENCPKGVTIGWLTSDDGGKHFKLVGKGETFQYECFESETIMVALIYEKDNGFDFYYTEDGKTVNDIEGVKVNNNIFIWIVYFFKSLLGISTVVKQ